MSNRRYGPDGNDRYRFSRDSAWAGDGWKIALFIGIVILVFAIGSCACGPEEVGWWRRGVNEQGL